MKKDDVYKEQKHLLNIKQNIWHHKICYIEMAINCFIVCIEKKIFNRSNRISFPFGDYRF